MTNPRNPGSTLAVLGLCLMTALWTTPAQAANKITCAEDGVRYAISRTSIA